MPSLYLFKTEVNEASNDCISAIALTEAPPNAANGRDKANPISFPNLVKVQALHLPRK
jgi:hypothetical protein